VWGEDASRVGAGVVSKVEMGIASKGGIAAAAQIDQYHFFVTWDFA
jgi:hypothetical protein